MSVCTYCEASTATGQYLCTPDRVTLFRLLGRVRDVLETAGGTLTNQAVAPVNTGGGAGSSAPGMPLNLDMLERAAHYRGLIGDWAGQVAEATNTTAPVDVLNRAAWLAKQTMNITRFEWAGDMLQELTYAERAVVNTADRHGGPILLGPCHALNLTESGSITRCDGTVTARQGELQARCDTCRTRHDAKQRKHEAVANAWHIIAPLPTILRALKQGDHAAIPQNRADKWASEGKLKPEHTNTATGRKHYTMAHVYEVFAATPTGKRQIADLQLQTVE